MGSQRIFLLGLCLLSLNCTQRPEAGSKYVGGTNLEVPKLSIPETTKLSIPLKATGEAAESAWTPAQSVSLEPSGQSLSVSIQGLSPIILSPFALDIDASKFKYLAITMDLAAGQSDTMQVFWWVPPAADFSEPASFSFGVAGTGQSQTYFLNLSENPLWTGRVERLRIDLGRTVSSGQIKIRSLEFLSQAPV